MLTFRNSLVRWCNMNVKTIPCNLGNYNIGRLDYLWIVIHYTASAGNAVNNGEYFAREDDLDASAHFFVDNDTIVTSVPIEDTAWHAGNSWVNANSIGIEVCSNGEDFTQAEIDNLQWLVCLLMDEYGIDADHVIRHYDVADIAPAYTYTQDPHKLCPAPYINAIKWRVLKDKITDKDGENEMTMHCLIRPDEMEYMVYYDGVNLHALNHPDEMKAVQEVYRLCNDGKEIPCFNLGAKDAPWASRFFDAVKAPAPDYGYYE